MWYNNQQDSFPCYPLVNTGTWVLAKSSLERFFEISGHSINLIEV